MADHVSFTPRVRGLQIPQDMICPLCHELMVDPVRVDADPTEGKRNVYERAEIQHWFDLGKRTDPLTMNPLRSIRLESDLDMKVRISQFKDTNAEIIAQLEEFEAKLQRCQLAAQVGIDAKMPNSVPLEYLCILTQSVMKQPVRAQDGFVYEERALQRWFADLKSRGEEIVSPQTKKAMGEATEKDSALALKIKNFVDEHFSKFDPSDPLLQIDTQASMVHMSSLFEALDGLEKILVETLGKWAPPHLVVVGEESVGKSSLLARLSLLPFFPTDKKRCTRMPVRVKIRRSASPGTATLQIYNCYGSPEGEARTLSLQDSDAEISKQMHQILRDAGLDPDSGAISVDKELHIEATSATLPPINLVDLPGIIATDTQLKAATESLFQRFVSSSSRDIFLAVVSAMSSPSSWTATRLVNENNLESRTIGVITNCDRLNVEDGEEASIKEVLNGGSVTGLVDLKPFGYVAVANVGAKSRDQYGSHSVWMKRRAEMEITRFKDTLNMADCVASNRVAIPALMFHIEKMYSQHVVSDWLPKTAECLLIKWDQACQELVQLGLPSSSGALQGKALDAFKQQATAECRRILDFLVQDTRNVYWTYVANPMKEYLEASLQGITQQWVHLLDLEHFLKARADQICENLPFNQFPDGTLQNAKSVLDEKGKELPFMLCRFPGVMRALSQNLEDNKPVLNVSEARNEISAFLKSVFVGPGSLSEAFLGYQQLDHGGHVTLTINVQHIVFVCLRKLSAACTALGSVYELESRVIAPALAEQEKEACHSARQRIYNQMKSYAEALEKLEMMELTSTGSVADMEQVKGSTDTLVKWWPRSALTVPWGTALGNDVNDNRKFKSEKCNRVFLAMGKARGEC